MIDMNLSDEALRQMGVLREGTHSTTFDESGSLHVTYQSQNDETADIVLSADDGLTKTVDSTKEGDSLREDIEHLRDINRHTRIISYVVLGIVVIPVIVALAILFKMR